MADTAPSMDQLERQEMAQATALEQHPEQDPAAKILAEGQAEQQPLQQQERAAVADLVATPRPGPAKLPETPNKPLVDPGEYSKFSAMLVGMAMIAGIASRGNWLGVSASLNGALKGHLEGDEETAKREWKKYEANYKKAMDEHEEAEKDYERTITNKKLTINQMLTEMQWKAAAKGDEYKGELARTKRIDELYKNVFDMKKSREELDLRRKQIDATLKARLGGGMAGLSPEADELFGALGVA